MSVTRSFLDVCAQKKLWERGYEKRKRSRIRKKLRVLWKRKRAR